MSVLIEIAYFHTYYMYLIHFYSMISRGFFMTFLLKKILLLLFSQYLNLIGFSNFNFEVTTIPNNML